MPKHAHAQLRWSSPTQSYILFLDNQPTNQTLTPAWLTHNTSFAFHPRSGIHFTARKQKAQRGDSYWYAYRRLHGRIIKRYLGKSADLTLARLEEIAELLNATPMTTTPPPVATSPLLFSKLSPPRLHTFLLDRPHQFALLDSAYETPFTLITAPAGFGKSTLVNQWLTTRRTDPTFPPIAWLSLETSDNDPTRFWRYLITACQAFHHDLAPIHTLLTATNPQPPFIASSWEPMLTSLLNSLLQTSSGGILILEDYHTITSPHIHETLFFFLTHLPPTIHVIMMTRTEPPFALTQLRAKNQLYEIHTSDLRFSQDETSTLLHQVLPFPLTPEMIHHLHTQMEGWVAGLHLTKLALQRAQPDQQSLTHLPHLQTSFQDYFVTEILNLQPAPIQQFLLQTSLLSRMTPALCDAVTNQAHSQDMLLQLEHANLFLEPLTPPMQTPSPQHWFRYHALFAEAMRAEAHRRFTTHDLHTLANRASRWYESHGFLNEAIDATLFAQNYPQAATLIEHSLTHNSLPGALHEPHTLHRWLTQFPTSILEQYPQLLVSYATTLLFQNTSWLPDTATLQTLARLLPIAEQAFQTSHNSTALGELSAFRALLAIRQTDRHTAIIQAKQALALLPPTHHIWRGLCLCISVEEQVEAGHFPQAHTTLLEAYSLCDSAGNLYFKHVALAKLAHVLFEMGELTQASSFYQQSLAGSKTDLYPITLCNSLLGLAKIHYLRNELTQASQHAQELLTISQERSLLHHETHATIILAHILHAQGNTLVAQHHLNTLLTKLPLTLHPLIQTIQATQAHLALIQGDHLTAQRWATNNQAPTDFSQHIAHQLLISRLLRSQNQHAEASHLLNQLLHKTQQAHNTLHTLTIQLELALLANTTKHKAEAHHYLRAALTEACKHNIIRPFLDSDAQTPTLLPTLLRSLLPQLHTHPLLLSYTHSLLNRFPLRQHNKTNLHNPYNLNNNSLLEPLSPQETRVLRLLAQHRSNADIANELIVSVNTIRTQLQSIYRKLNVPNRSAATQRAHDLHLL